MQYLCQSETELKKTFSDWLYQYCIIQSFSKYLFTYAIECFLKAQTVKLLKNLRKLTSHMECIYFVMP